MRVGEQHWVHVDCRELIPATTGAAGGETIRCRAVAWRRLTQGGGRTKFRVAAQQLVVTTTEPPGHSSPLPGEFHSARRRPLLRPSASQHIC